MSDELYTPGAVPPTGDEVSGKRPGLLSTTTGKIVAILVGLGVLGIIAGIAVAIVLFVFGSQAVQELEDQMGETTITETTESDSDGVTAQAEAPAEEVANSEVFTFRDIFVPLIKPLPEETTTTTTGTTTTSTTDNDTVTPTANNTLYLDGVVTQNGVMMAVLRYNGTSYTLGPGGAIPNSPWQVLRVSSSSVTMLYGDVQVTLSVGQGITK